MARYSEELIEEIKNSNDIVDIISQYMTLKRSGRNFFGLCPFHGEKSPSFSVSPEKQIYHCFGCGEGGNVYKFLMNIENIDFLEAVEILAKRANIELPKLENSEDIENLKLKEKVYEINKIAAEFYHENLYGSNAKLAQEYVKKRKLDNKTLKNFLIGYAGNYNELYLKLKENGFSEKEMLASALIKKNDEGKFFDSFRKRLMFPIQDIRGKIVAFGGRVLDDSKPKYINSPETIIYSKGKHLFGLYNAKKYDLKKIIIVEGYMDVISLQQRGVTNVVASLGTALTENQGYLLRRVSEKIVIGYDADGAGQAATMRGLEILQKMGCDIRILQIEGAKDPDEFILKYGPEKFKIYVDSAISLVEYKIKMLKKNLDLDNTNDKIKFLKEIAKVISKVDNDIEKEVYIDKLARQYKISKEAIVSEIMKLTGKAFNNIKTIERHKVVEPKLQKEEVSQIIQKRENMLVYLLINYPKESFEKMKNVVDLSDIKIEKNGVILQKLFEEMENGNYNTMAILDKLQDEEIINHLTGIMITDLEVKNIEKCIDDMINLYQKEKLNILKNKIINQLENDKDLTKEESHELEKELSNIIIKLAKIK